MIVLNKLSRKHKLELLKLLKYVHIGFPLFCYKRKFILISHNSHNSLNSIRCDFSANIMLKVMLAYGWVFLKILNLFFKFNCPSFHSLMGTLVEIEITVDDNLMREILEEHNLYEYLI